MNNLINNEPVKYYATHFQLMFHVFTPENIKNLEVFWCFQGVKKWNAGWESFNIVKAKSRPLILSSLQKKKTNSTNKFQNYSMVS